MFSRFYPNEYVKSVYVIDYDELYKRGKRGIIFDIDNTLVRHNEKVTEDCKNLINHLKEIGFKVFLLSNNIRSRVEPFAKELDVPFICKAGKPNPNNYLEAKDLMRLRRDKVVFIGDQIFTDIYGAKKAEIYSILTRPISKKEYLHVALKRILEKPILSSYLRHKI